MCINSSYRLIIDSFSYNKSLEESQELKNVNFFDSKLHEFLESIFKNVLNEINFKLRHVIVISSNESTLGEFEAVLFEQNVIIVGLLYIAQVRVRVR